MVIQWAVYVPAGKTIKTVLRIQCKTPSKTTFHTHTKINGWTHIMSLYKKNISVMQICANISRSVGSYIRFSKCLWNINYYLFNAYI